MHVAASFSAARSHLQLGLGGICCVTGDSESALHLAPSVGRPVESAASVSAPILGVPRNLRRQGPGLCIGYVSGKREAWCSVWQPPQAFAIVCYVYRHLHSLLKLTRITRVVVHFQVPIFALHSAQNHAPRGGFTSPTHPR